MKIKRAVLLLVCLVLLFHALSVPAIETGKKLSLDTRQGVFDKKKLDDYFMDRFMYPKAPPTKERLETVHLGTMETLTEANRYKSTGETMKISVNTVAPVFINENEEPFTIRIYQDITPEDYYISFTFRSDVADEMNTELATHCLEWFLNPDISEAVIEELKNNPESLSEDWELLSSEGDGNASIRIGSSEYAFYVFLEIVYQTDEYAIPSTEISGELVIDVNHPDVKKLAESEGEGEDKPSVLTIE